MDQNNLIDLVIENKKFSSYKVLSRGKFSATIEVDYKNKQKKTAALVLSKKESESRRFDFQDMQNAWTVQYVQHEYMSKLQTYLIYTETGEITLQDKIRDKSFRKSPGAIESVFNWIKQTSMGLKQLHSKGYVHLNLQSSSILITNDDRAQIGCFDFARHSSTENESFECGSKPYYRPPESFATNSPPNDGKKIDVWCLAMMTVEVLTNNYISKKSNQITSWPEQYGVLHKLLQAPKFQKIVKKIYPKAANVENLEKSLLLIKHTMKFYPDERPNISEFFMLLFELAFCKDITKKLIEEKIWQNKVSLMELKIKMQCMALKQNPSFLLKSEITKIDSNVRIMWDVVSNQLHGRRNEITEFPFEHRDLYQSEVFSSGMKSLKSEKVQIVKSDPYEKTDSNDYLRKHTDEEIFLSKQKKAFKHQSEIFVPDLAEKIEDVYTGEKAECSSKNNEENKSSIIFTAKGIFQKIVNWTFDEIFYTGVMHSGSLINQLSKNLTG